MREFEWDRIGKHNFQTEIKVGDQVVVIDVIKDAIHEIGVDAGDFNLYVTIDNVSFDRAIIAAEKFINGLTPDMLKNKMLCREFLLGCLGQSTKAELASKLRSSGIEVTSDFKIRKNDVKVATEVALASEEDPSTLEDLVSLICELHGAWDEAAIALERLEEEDPDVVDEDSLEEAQGHLDALVAEVARLKHMVNELEPGYYLHPDEYGWQKGS